MMDILVKIGIQLLLIAWLVACIFAPKHKISLFYWLDLINEKLNNKE